MEEWLWLTGYYLRARLHCAHKLDVSRGAQPADAQLPAAVAQAKELLGRLETAVHESPFKSLPELTNKDGAVCFSFYFYFKFIYYIPFIISVMSECLVSNDSNGLSRLQFA